MWFNEEFLKGIFEICRENKEEHGKRGDWKRKSVGKTEMKRVMMEREEERIEIRSFLNTPPNQNPFVSKRIYIPYSKKKKPYHQQKEEKNTSTANPLLRFHTNAFTRFSF